MSPSDNVQNVDKVATLRAYYKLCSKPEHRSIVLKDKVFVSLLNSLLNDDNPDVIRYVVKILLLLTQRSEDVEQLLSESSKLLPAVSEACERISSPSVNYNLVLISSRLRVIEDSRKQSKIEDPLVAAVKEIDRGGSLHRKFVGRKSKQMVFEFDWNEFDEAKKHDVERALLNKKGVISVYFTETKHPRAVLRTVPTVESQEIADLLFNCGCEYIVQLVKVDGVEERFEMYASERLDKAAPPLPDYLDEEAFCDPTSCVVTNEMAAHNHVNGGGWFNSISSFAMFLRPGTTDFITSVYNTVEADYDGIESRASRIRAAMFPDWNPPTSSATATTSRSSIVEMMQAPARELKDAVLTLLTYEGSADMTGLPLPDLIELLGDQDEAVVSRAVHRIYVLSREDPSIANNARLIEALLAASRSSNVNVRRNAIGALWHMSESRGGPMLIFRSGGLAEIIRMLHDPHESVVHYAVTTLRNLLMHVEASKPQARALKAIEALTPHLHKSNPKLLAQVADSLYFLLIDDLPSKDAFLSLSGPQILVTILRAYTEHRKLMYTVIRCIRSLSVCPRNKPALISLGCLPALYNELCRATDERTQTAVLVAMRNLSDAATNEENLTPLVVKLLEIIRVSNDAMTACACGILSNLTCNNMRNKQTVCSHGGIDALVTAIRRFPDVEDATEPALCALRHCTARHSLAEEAQNELRLCRAFPIVLDQLATLRTPVIKAALGVIRNCALLPANLMELTQEETEHGDSVVSLTVDILRRAVTAIEENPSIEVDGVPMWGVIEGAVSALHQLANHPAVASVLCDDRGQPGNAEQPPFLDLVVHVLARPDVVSNQDELLERELLGLLYQLSKRPDGARAVEEAGATTLLMESRGTQHKAVATYANGVLKNLEHDGDYSNASTRAYDYDSGNDWQRDGMERELFAEMYPTSDGGHRESITAALSHNNNNWVERTMNVVVESAQVLCPTTARTARVIAIDAATGKLAVIRKTRVPKSHDFVEFYNVLTGWISVLERVVCPENGSIEHAIFVGSELMTSHANGSVCMIDPHSAERPQRCQVASSTIWSSCIYRRPTTSEGESSHYIVALASHSSAVFFFDATSRVILYSVPTGVDSRLFCVASSGDLTAVGVIDGVVIISDRAIKHTLKLDRQTRRDPTIAWSVLFWKENLLACGDSCGNVSLWNPQNAALIQIISCLQSHVLSMCINDGLLNVAGVDPRITVVSQTAPGEFRVVKRRTGPVRDVRCLASYNDRVYASGEDFDVFVGKDGCRPLAKQLQRNVRMVGEITASAGDSWIDLYYDQNGEEDGQNGSIVLKYKQIHFARIFSPEKSVIQAWAVSKDGKFLAISTSHETTAYAVDVSSKKIQKLKWTAPPSTAIHISQNSCFLSTGDFQILRFSLQDDDASRVFLEQTGCGIATQLSVSECEKHAIVMTSRAQVFVVNLEKAESRVVRVDLPIDVLCNSSSAFVLSTQEAIVDNCEDKKVFHEVSLANGSVLHSASAKALHLNSFSKTTPSLPIAILPIDDHRFVLSTANASYSIIDTQKKSCFNEKGGAIEDYEKEAPAYMVAVRQLPASSSQIPSNQSLTNGGVPSTPNRPRTRRISTMEDKNANEHPGFRVVLLEVRPDEQPKVDAFKLRRFGMQ
ncbi:unnamed protein product [Caenorhabditis auriculariae]|uniref:Uncharacterized protein n=1 Tax=Caenorhabditis auriculariae TaxID=2777116 RepID=A0A8S1H6N3_9PELO|nr:unnamed protein product [Caenorhabditis auriculariae]